MIDYAHNYISMYRLYEMVKKTMKPKSITVVFGCGGERYKKRREDMGRLAEQYADKVVLTMEDPGFESCEEICKEIKQYITKPCYIIGSRLSQEPSMRLSLASLSSRLERVLRVPRESTELLCSVTLMRRSSSTG